MRSNVPVIMITAYGDEDIQRTALERGAETLLTKPIDFAALRAEIDTRAGCLTPARAYPIAAMHFGR